MRVGADRVSGNLPRSVDILPRSRVSGSLGASVERINAQEITAKNEDQGRAFILPTDVYFFPFN